MPSTLSLSQGENGRRGEGGVKLFWTRCLPQNLWVKKAGALPHAPGGDRSHRRGRSAVAEGAQVPDPGLHAARKALPITCPGRRRAAGTRLIVVLRGTGEFQQGFHRRRQERAIHAADLRGHVGQVEQAHQARVELAGTFPAHGLVAGPATYRRGPGRYATDWQQTEQAKPPSSSHRRKDRPSMVLTSFRQHPRRQIDTRRANLIQSR